MGYGKDLTKTDLPTAENAQIQPPATQEDDPNEEITGTRICKPTQQVQDLLEGNATWTNWSKAQKMFPGVQLPSTAQADVADWAMHAIDKHTFADNKL